MNEESWNFIHRFLERHGTTVNTIFEFATVLVNFFHLLTLLSKELRSNSVFILMIGIAVCDIFAFLKLYLRLDVSFGYDHSIDDLLLHNDYRISCVYRKYCLFSGFGVVIWILNNSTRPISVWLAILMALIRTLSIIFPMSIRVQNLTKPGKVVIVSLIICVFWFGFYSWNFRELRYVRIPDVVSEISTCRKVTLSPDHDISILAKKPICLDKVYTTNDVQGYSTKFETREPLVRLVPALIYPLVTVPLLFELFRIKKKRKTSQADKTTILIFIMTISFMLSEGLQGFFSCLDYNCLNLSDDNSEVAYLIFGYPSIQIFESFRSLNALSHFFVCYWMSSQYRTVANRVLFCLNLGDEEENKVENLTVQEAFSTSAQSSRSKTSRRITSNS
ncbi:hypothetical protein CAEBREN_31667 [Caenorhabditis brenneri]|uniref:G-protein coupled receptors family 1 profile domain-containing protein n=1 Tax=Caenorhabditis brenneri TaxID=135651 RepID=G0NI94_CAEBE|nr:hypothetical protein CAEBREN_31667 [Caenorhabditis brenneri]